MYKTAWRASEREWIEVKNRRQFIFNVRVVLVGTKIEIKNAKMLAIFFLLSSLRLASQPRFPTARRKKKPASNNCRIILAHFLSPHRESVWGGPLWQLHKTTSEKLISPSLFPSSSAAGEMEEWRQEEKNKQNGSLWVHSTCLMDLDFFSFLLLRPAPSWLIVGSLRACGLWMWSSEEFFVSFIWSCEKNQLHNRSRKN